MYTYPEQDRRQNELPQKAEKYYLLPDLDLSLQFPLQCRSGMFL